MKRPITKDELERKREQAMKQAHQQISKGLEKPVPKKHLDAARKKFDEYAGKAYNSDFADNNEIEKKLGQPVNLWGTYEVHGPLDDASNKVSELSKHQFECYCCGWLQYYDEITRNGAIDHTIWFKWRGKNCSVFIYPEPGSAFSPLTSTGTSDPQNPTAPPPPY